MRVSLFLEVPDGMVKRGIEVRLIHAKDPGPNWRDDFDRAFCGDPVWCMSRN